MTDFIAALGLRGQPHYLDHMRSPKGAPRLIANQVLAQFNQRMRQAFLRAMPIQAVIFKLPRIWRIITKMNIRLARHIINHDIAQARILVP